MRLKDAKITCDNTLQRPDLGRVDSMKRLEAKTRELERQYPEAKMAYVVFNGKDCALVRNPETDKPTWKLVDRDIALDLEFGLGT